MKKGFTIIESIVALTIIIAAVIGPFMLISRGILSSKSAKNRLVAANLAQEEIEMIRYFRDSNVLASCVGPDGADFDENPDPDWRAITDTSSNCTTLANGNWEVDATYDLTDAEPRLIAFGASGRFLNFCQTPPTATYPNYGLYAYSCLADPNPQVTTFKRKITISDPGPETVCIDPPGPAPCSGTSTTIPASDRIKVDVTILWQDGSISRTLVQTEILYNWR